MVELGSAFKTNGSTPDYGGLAPIVASLKDSVVAELREDFFASVIDQLVRRLGTLQITAEAPKVSVAPPNVTVAPAVTNVAVTAPDLEDVTVNVTGLEALPTQLHTIEQLLRELLSVSRQPLTTTVLRDPNNLIQSTTQKRG